MIEAAAALGEYLIVIVNNDIQAVMKKGKIILDAENRLRLIRALRVVDEAMLSRDTEGMSQTMTLQFIHSQYPDNTLLFANGGDRICRTDTA